MKSLVPSERIENRIYFLRGQKVMFSTHLAELYEVEPRALVQAVKRNIERFPPDFMFQLSKAEFKEPVEIPCFQAGQKGPKCKACEKQTSGGVLKKYVGARRSSATKQMGLFQRSVKNLKSQIVTSS